MEQIVEFHDSIVSGTEIKEDRLLIVFSHAYVYANGSGWSRKATLMIRDGVLTREPSSYPVSVAEGELLMDTMKFYDLLEVPFSQQGRCELKLVLANGERIIVAGSDPQMILQGEREFVESVEMP